MKTEAFIPAFSNGKELYFMFSLLEYDGVPIIFVCSDSDEKWYLCDCVEFRDYQRWTISKTTATTLADILNQKVSVYDALSFAEECRVVDLDYETDEYSQKTVPFSCLRHEDLPQRGAMLRYYDAKADDYVAMLNALTSKKEADLVASVSFGEANTVTQYECESVPFETGTISAKAYSTDKVVCYNDTENEVGNCLPNLAFAA